MSSQGVDRLGDRPLIRVQVALGSPECQATAGSSGRLTQVPQLAVLRGCSPSGAVPEVFLDLKVVAACRFIRNHSDVPK
jgi:hypothetical protein